MKEAEKRVRQERFSTQNNLLTGITLGAWLSVLWKYGRWVEWRVYWFRVLFLTLMAMLNSSLALINDLFYSKAVAKTTINDSPVFIIGNPRTGTTLLHNMLSLDKDRFSYATTLAAGFSAAFLLLEPVQHLLKGVISEKRPMDNMPLTLDAPQEDELAMNQMSGCISQYGCIPFLTHQDHFMRFLTMDSEEGVTKNEKKKYINTLLGIFEKLAYKAEGRRLLLKSPSHTAKIELLLELFPKAQFIFIHRNPYDVFKSMVHMAETTYCYSYLATPKHNDLVEYSLTLYEKTYNAYLDARHLIPQGNLIEIAFDDLQNDKIACMKNIYTTLGWAGFHDMQKSYSQYVANIKTYKRNSFPSISPKHRALVNKRWERSFEEFGYCIWV
eukprot:m.20949 g.20949  ORF g.20949 m.20949 type:complete len:384 (+) comp5303_c0_seq1:49-1200(+)